MYVTHVQKDHDIRRYNKGSTRSYIATYCRVGVLKDGISFVGFFKGLLIKNKMWT